MFQDSLKDFLAVRSACGVCGLDLTKVDSGDGPAVFVIFVVGFIAGGGALWLERTYAPPTWVHMAIWLPLILVLGIGLLRPFKSALIALQYKHKAAPGVLDE